MSRTTKKLQKIARRLTTHQLRRLPEKEVDLSYEELFGGTSTERSSLYFLGYYSPAGIRYAMEKYGFFDELRKKGFDNFELCVDTKDLYKQRIAIYSEKRDPHNMLGELVVKRKHVTVYTHFPASVHGRTFETIAVEWLCMQNPRAEFSSERPRLPGQKHPGLGMGEMVMVILIIMCNRLRTAGLLNIPEHFHNAQMYSPQFIYIDPVFEGRRRAIARDLLSRHSLAETSWAIDKKCVRENGDIFNWFISEKIIPLDRDLKEYFESKEYINFVKEVASQYHYQIDEAAWKRAKENLDEDLSC